MKEKFVQLSKIHQDMANTKEEAVKNFNTSCHICSSRGIKLDCDKCPVKAYHELVVAVFDDLEEYKKMKNENTLNT